MAYCFGGPHLIVGVESAYATRLLSTSYGYTIGSLVRDGPTCATVRVEASRSFGLGYFYGAEHNIAI